MAVTAGTGAKRRVRGSRQLGIVAWWAWRAFQFKYDLDVGLAYQAGQLAWANGHPEHLASWDGTSLWSR